jgi:hypothetical protein
MATKPTLSNSPFAIGDEEESNLANQRYKDAYDKLTLAVEARSEKPWFDPTLLAAAQGLLAPTRTGNFFESLGNAAGTIGKAQEAEQTKAEELARMRLELAGMCVQQANQKAGMKDFYSGSQPSPKVGQQAEPQAAPQAGQQASPSSNILSSMGFEDQGQQIGPPQPLPTEKQFVGGKVATGMNAIEARMEYQKLLRDDLKVGPNGTVYQISTGKLFAPEDPTPIQIPFMTLGGENFTVNKKQANQLNNFTNSGDTQGRIDYENKLRGIQKQPQQPPVQPSVQPPVQPPIQPPAQPPMGVQTAPVAAPVVKTAPVAAPVAAPVESAPVGMQPESARARLKAEEDQKRAIAQAIAIKKGEAEVASGLGADAKFQETIGSKRGDLAVAEETRIAQSAKNAGKLFTAADTVLNSVKQSPSYFGVFNKPGALNAVGSTLSEAAKPGGKFTIVDVEGQVVKLMPGTTTENLVDREKAASALAEIELGYTQMYLAKQGAVTEGERRIVRAIPGGLSSSPKFLELKGKLIRERAQYDMDLNLAYAEYLKLKPNGDALDFKRNSTLYKGLHKAFELKTAELAGTIPALPTKERQSPAKSNDASSYVQDLLKRRGQQ